MRVCIYLQQWKFFYKSPGEQSKISIHLAWIFRTHQKYSGPSGWPPTPSTSSNASALCNPSLDCVTLRGGDGAAHGYLGLGSGVFWEREVVVRFNFPKFRLRVCIKIINYFNKARSEWNFHKRFMGSLDNYCPSLSTKYETCNTSWCYKNQHSLLTRKVIKQDTTVLLWLYNICCAGYCPSSLCCCLLYICLRHYLCHSLIRTIAPSISKDHPSL